MSRIIYLTEEELKKIVGGENVCKEIIDRECNIITKVILNGENEQEQKPADVIVKSEAKKMVKMLSGFQQKSIEDFCKTDLKSGATFENTCVLSEKIVLSVKNPTRKQAKKLQKMACKCKNAKLKYVDKM